MNAQTPIIAQQVLIAANELRNATARFQHVMERINIVPVLGTVKITGKAGSQTVTMSGTNLDIYLHQAVEAEVARDFDHTIPLQTLAAIANGASGLVSLNADGDVLTMSADELTATIRLVSKPEDFPWLTEGDMKDLTDAPTTPISEPELHRLFTLGKHCISSEETRYYLNGSFLTKNPDTNTLRSVTTDGHRLSVIDTDTPTDNAPDVIIHRKAVLERVWLNWFHILRPGRSCSTRLG